MKIAILGYSGSGKSTLARQLGQRYQIPVLHLDTINFLPNWQQQNPVTAQAIVQKFMQQDSWVIDGNYSYLLQEQRLNQANQIIYLNFPRRICFLRAVKRYIKNYGKTRCDMAQGCNEKLDKEFIMWILCKGRTRQIRLRYQSICSQYADKIVCLKSPTQVKKFLAKK